jgi:DNA gyrase subunit A
MSIRFDEEDVRAMGRSAVGVWGIRPEDGDEVCGMVVIDGGDTLLTVCENGYGKRTAVEEYRQQGRGGKGVIDIRTTERNGHVVNILAVKDDDEVMMITKDGQIVRTAVGQISVIGRNTQGVRCISLNDGDKLVSVALIPSEEPEGEGETPAASEPQGGAPEAKS